MISVCGRGSGKQHWQLGDGFVFRQVWVITQLRCLKGPHSYFANAYGEVLCCGQWALLPKPLSTVSSHENACGSIIENFLLPSGAREELSRTTTLFLIRIITAVEKEKKKSRKLQGRTRIQLLQNNKNKQIYSITTSGHLIISAHGLFSEVVLLCLGQQSFMMKEEWSLCIPQCTLL